MEMTKGRLMTLQRTIDTLEVRLQDMQWEIRQGRGLSMTERFWRNLLGPWQGNAFMSACCNRKVRPNTKVMNHVGTTTGH